MAFLLACSAANCAANAVLFRDPANPAWPERDRLILSKGHAGAAIYAALAERGFFPVEELKTHYQNGSRLSGHVSHKGVPGVEFSTGSLGHGLPVAEGMAMAGSIGKLVVRRVSPLTMRFAQRRRSASVPRAGTVSSFTLSS